MNRTPPSDVLKELATRHGLCHTDGTVNYNSFGRFSDLSPVTVRRIVRAEETWDMSRKVAMQLMKSFNLTEAQARGYESLEEVQKEKGYVPTKKDLQLLQNFRNLDPKDQNKIEKYINFLNRMTVFNLNSDQIAQLFETNLKNIKDSNL